MENKTNEKIACLNTSAFTHNAFIIWKPEYDLGITIIDEQHRGMVSIINSLHFGMLNEYVREMLAPIVDMIFNYTDIHFRVEEDFQDSIGYPDVKGHKELHYALSAQLVKIGRKSMLDKDPYNFLDFLKKWWIDHICEEDLKYRDYLL